MDEVVYYAYDTKREEYTVRELAPIVGGGVESAAQTDAGNCVVAFVAAPAADAGVSG